MKNKELAEMSKDYGIPVYCLEVAYETGLLFKNEGKGHSIRQDKLLPKVIKHHFDECEYFDKVTFKLVMESAWFVGFHEKTVVSKPSRKDDSKLSPAEARKMLRQHGVKLKTFTHKKQLYVEVPYTVAGKPGIEVTKFSHILDFNEFMK